MSSHDDKTLPTADKFCIRQGGCSKSTMSKPRTNLDWTRNPPPTNITPFQKFIRDVDWSQTSLGVMNSWSRELRQTVRFMMADNNPAILYWGDSYTIIYNEAYVPLVGNKHPEMLGKNAPTVFPDFWDFFDEIITNQRVTGETCTGEASMLLMQRRGFLEETYFDWKLVPVIGDDGEMQGSYGMPSDRTGEVIGARRTANVHNLSLHTSKVSNINDLWPAILEGFRSNEKDIHSALLYSIDQPAGLISSPREPSYQCHLEGCLGLSKDHSATQQELNLQTDLDGFAPVMLKAFRSRSIIKIDASEASLNGLYSDIPCNSAGTQSSEFAIIPIKSNAHVSAFLVIGLNPHQRFDHSYQEYLQLLSDVIATQISKLRLSEEVKHRDEVARRAMVDFQRSEMRFSRFAERSVVGLAVTDVEGKVLYANDAWYKFSGLNPSQNESLNWLDSVIEEDVPVLEEWWNRLFTEKKGGTFQFRSRQPFDQGHMHSDYRTGICACYPDLNEAGDVETIMGLIMDISEQKWIEEQLLMRTKDIEKSEAKYRNFAEHAPLGIVRTDINGHVLFGNNAWHAFYGFTKGQVMAPQPWLPYIHDDDLQRARDYFIGLQKESGPSTVELRLKRTYSIFEGDRMIENDAWILATGYTDFRPDGSSSIDFWVTDISQIKMASKILTEKMEDAIRVKEQQERFIDMISHEIRNPLSAVLHCGEEVVEAMKSCLTTMDALPDSNLTTSKDLPLYSMMRSHANSALDAANTIMYCVQHQKQIVDDVLTLSKLDSDLLVVSPVPFQPIPLVRSSLKIFEPELKMTDINLEVIEDESLAELGVEWVLIDPNRFLQIVINLITNAIKFTRKSKTRNIIVRVSARTDKPPRLFEGVEFVPRRYIQPKPVSPNSDRAMFIEPQQDIYLYFSVADTGKGLTESERALLFKRFAQASPKTHIEYGGSGLGLFISKQITEMLGGEIGVGSSPGQGCTFAFYVKTAKVYPPRRPSTTIEPIFHLTRTLSTPENALHAVSQSKQQSALAENTLPTPKPLTAKRKVLVVEDNLVNQKVLCKQLRNRGFLVAASNHGKEALDALTAADEEGKSPTQSNFDVVLCDIEMPVMDGIECVKQVRKLEASGELPGHIPIIGVTANVRSKQVNAAVECGMDGVTTKPYRIDELIAHIDRFCPAEAI